MPKWPITVTEELYAAVADPMGEPYADSYLWGAVVRGTKLIPHTVTAWERPKQSYHVRQALSLLKIELIKPAPWGSPGGSDRASAELIDPLDERRPYRRRPDHDAW